MSDYNYNQPNPYTQASGSSPYGNSLDYPGKVMGIVAMILSLLNIIAIPTALIGAILGHVAYSQSKRAGIKNIYALIAIIAGWVIVGITILFFGLIILISLPAHYS